MMHTRPLQNSASLSMLPSMMHDPDLPNCFAGPFADDVVDAARKIISRCKQSEDMQDRLDRWVFCPHYPYPPRGRRWAIGMQSAANQSTLLTHATHAGAEASGITEQFVYSNSVERPLWRVMLWYNNPYHFLTGFVEASVSHGRPSQTDKALGGEHPMWLVSSHSPLHSERNSIMLGPGRVDRFFDNWLPVLASPPPIPSPPPQLV
jgi:hypothetical protein